MNFIERIDHFVLTVRDITATCEFYTRVLGMHAVTFGDNRKALHFGSQKINLHEVGSELEPGAANPAPGTADVCFITNINLEQAIEHIQSCGVEIVAGPVQRTGARASLRSIYIRDPDGNLIEISNYISPDAARKTPLSGHLPTPPPPDRIADSQRGQSHELPEDKYTPSPDRSRSVPG